MTTVDATSADEVRSGLVADALRHHVRLIAVCALLGLALGYLAGMTSSTTFTSKATVYVNPLLGNPYSPDGSGDSLTNLETEAQLVRSDLLANQVASLTGLDAEALQRHLTVSVPINTQIVEIAFTSANADEAKTVVNDFADGYLAARQDNRDGVVRDQASNLDQQITDTQAKLQIAAGKADRNPYQARLAQTLTGQLGSLRIQAAQVSESLRDPGRVISPGAAASAPNGISTTLTLVGGLLAGLVLALLLAVSRERSSHVVRHLEQVEQAGIPVLGVFTGKRDENRAAVYRQVRAGLGAHPPATLAIAAARSGSAAEVVAAELAQSYTHSVPAVALVDGVGGASRRFGLQGGGSGQGLSDVLADQVSLDEALLREPKDAPAQVHVLPPGTDPVEGAERYSSEAMASLLRALSSRCQPVLLATPGLSEPDGSALATQADAVLLVIALDQTTYTDLIAARERLNRSATVLMGAVVISKSSRRSPFGGGTVLGTTTPADVSPTPPPTDVSPTPPPAKTPPRPVGTIAAATGATAKNGSSSGPASGGAPPAGNARPGVPLEPPARETASKTSGSQAPSVPHG